MPPISKSIHSHKLKLENESSNIQISSPLVSLFLTHTHTNTHKQARKKEAHSQKEKKKTDVIKRSRTVYTVWEEDSQLTEYKYNRAATQNAGDFLQKGIRDVPMNYNEIS